MGLLMITEFVSSSKLLMTVEGGPYDSLYPGYGKYAVLYGDEWDRGYKYNASTNHDLNLLEGAHSDLFIEGIVEEPEKKMVVTVGTDGAVAFWNLTNNKTFYRFADLAGKNVSLTDMIITPNKILVITAARRANNIFFLPLDQLGMRDPVDIDGDHDGNVTRVRLVWGVPMFLTLSGGMNDTSKIVRWSASDPPIVMGHYESRGVLDMDGEWGMKRLYLGKLDKSLEVLDMKSGSKKAEKKDAHKGPVTGVAVIPKIGYVVSGGGFKVKIWDKELKIVEVLNDSKATISGRVMYKMDDKLIGAVNLKGIVFWLQCTIKHCAICAKKGKSCFQCEKGYKVHPNKKSCVKRGSALDAIHWELKHLNIDRTKFRISFPEMYQTEFHRMYKNVDPRKNVKLHVGDDSSTRENFDLRFIDNPYKKVWDFECKFKKGLGLRDLNAIIINETSRRILTAKKPKTSLKPSFFYEPGPKKVAIPSMPAFPFSLIPFFYVVGTIYRIIFWLCNGLIVLDLTRRLTHKKSWDFIRLLRYCITYSTVSLISLLKINMRPVVTESNIGLHEAIHLEYYLFVEIHLHKKSFKHKYFFEKHKITEYGFNLIFLDHCLIPVGFYVLFLFLGFVLCGSRPGKYFNALKFITFVSGSIQMFFSACLQIMNSFAMDNSTFYINISFWFAVGFFVFLSLELIRLIIVGGCGKIEEVKSVFRPKTELNLKSFTEAVKKVQGGKRKKVIKESSSSFDQDSNPPSLVQFDKKQKGKMKKENREEKKTKAQKQENKKVEPNVKVPFFLNTSLIWKRMKTSMSMMSTIRTSQIPDLLSKFFLDINNICQEFVGSYMKPEFTHSLLASSSTFSSFSEGWPWPESFSSSISIEGSKRGRFWE
jgi:hypothetical protein